MLYILDFPEIVFGAHALILKITFLIFNSLPLTFWKAAACYLARIIIISVNSIQSEEKHFIMSLRPWCVWGLSTL